MPGSGSSEMKTVAGFTVTVCFMSRREEVVGFLVPPSYPNPRPSKARVRALCQCSALSRRHLQGPSPQKGPGVGGNQMAAHHQVADPAPPSQAAPLKGLPSLAPSPSPLWSRNCLKCKAPTCSPVGQAQHSAPGILGVQKVVMWMNE